MKPKSLKQLAALGLLAAGLGAPFHATGQSIFELGAAEPKQSSEDFKPAPATIETNFGTLEFTGGGYPTEETVQRVYDELDLQRATQLYLDLFPALSVPRHPESAGAGFWAFAARPISVSRHRR